MSASPSPSFDRSALPRWDLTSFYPSHEAEAISKDREKLEALSQAFAQQYAGKLSALSADALAQAIAEYEALEELAGKLGSYAQLFYCENVIDDAHARFYQNISEELTRLGSLTLFFTLELNELNEEEYHSKLQESERLRHYEPWLRDVRQLRPYQLAQSEEKILFEKSITGRAAWSRLYDETLAGMKFTLNGEEFSSEEMLDKMSSPRAEERKQAAKCYGEGLGEKAGLFTLITNTLAKDKQIEDNLRGYQRPIDSRNMANAVEAEVVEALLTSVKRYYPQLSHRYYALKAKWLGKDQLDYWDRNAPLPEAGETIYSWEDATRIVLDSYADFSPEMAKIGQRFFDENWIDAPASAGKAGGAFSHPTVPSVHPYILLNYLGKPRDVMTLAHELGHGVHQVLSAEQGALMADTPLTLAETASVFGEQLTFRALLKAENDPAKRKALLAHKVEDMLNTVVRQIAFCQFEVALHDARKQGELSTEEINQIWMQVQSESLGPALRFDEEYAYYWTYIPHFIHTPFYVYAYAFGDCLVNSLYAVYQQDVAAGKADHFVEKYLTMLKAGGTLRHKELLAPFDLDASQPSFWETGLNIISTMIDELEK